MCRHQLPAQAGHLRPPLRCSTIKGMDALEGVPIAGCLGDQQAAMVGQRCAVREAKNTYGTGAQGAVALLSPACCRCTASGCCCAAVCQHALR